MKEKIAEMYAQALIDDLAPNVFADQVLRLFGVSGQVCDNCGEGVAMVCQKCYDTESQFRESY